MLAGEIRCPRLEIPRLGTLPVAPLPPQARAIAPSSGPMARARREYGSTAVDMVNSHVETLIERVTGVDKAAPDGDGDYPVR